MSTRPKTCTVQCLFSIVVVVAAVCRKFDVMDSMLHKLEKYADNLEDIVQQRTADLIDEKQKTDMLLHRMLPP